MGGVEPWGLTEMWIEDPDGLQIVLVEVPADRRPPIAPRSAVIAILSTQ
jgi:hypothetical protein